MGRWIYRIKNDNTVEAVSAARFQRFYDDPESREFPDSAGRYARFVSLVIEYENRKFKKVQLASFHKYKVSADGSFDQKDKTEMIYDGAAASEPDFLSSLHKEQKGNVIESRAKFARKKYAAKHMWKPTREIMEKVHQLFVKRAGVDAPWQKWPVYRTT